MKQLLRQFLGPLSPMATLTGTGLLLMATARFAHAIIAFLGILWIYGLTALSVFPARRIFPQRGRRFVIIFIASFFCGLYLFVLSLLIPLAAFESCFFVSLIPLLCAASGSFRHIEADSLPLSLQNALTQALLPGLPLLIFALVREPLGYASLSVPGGAQGMLFLFSAKSGSFESGSFLPIRIATVSSGALLLLGYCLGLYRIFKHKTPPKEAAR